MNRCIKKSRISVLFFGIVALGAAVVCQAATVSKPSFSYKHGFYDSAFDVKISSATSGAAIRYTTNGTQPTSSTGTQISNGATVRISATTCLRAVAFMAGMTDSAVQTQTYIFPGQVVNQPSNPAGFPLQWYRWQWGGTYAKETADYAMDSRILNQYGATKLKNSLKALPTLSVVLKTSDMFHSASLVVYGQSPQTTIDEKAASLELIYPDDPSKGFQIDCAIRSHSWTQTKRALRVKFKSPFGPTRLDYPFFERAPLYATTQTGFDKLILRSGGNDNWQEIYGSTYTRDPWAAASQRAMHGVGPRGLFVHLYINGLYWGIYNPVERPDASHAALWFGGSSGDWFAGHHAGDISGNDDRYDQLIALAQQGNYTEVKKYMDMDKFFDYLLLAWYNGHVDWPRNNYYYVNRNNPVEKLFWITWDAEYSWDLEGPGKQTPGVVNAEFRPGASAKYPLTKIWHGLRGNSAFIADFSRRVDLHCFGTGALVESNSKSRWTTLCNHVDEAIYAECARWGDVNASRLVTHLQWEQDRDRVRNLMTGVVGRYIGNLKSYGYYVDPPPATPAAPSSLAAASQSATSVGLTWADNSSNETQFKLERSLNGTSWSQIATPGANATAYTDSGLSPSTKYYYRVRAANSAGSSGYSNVASATTGENAPAAPSSLAAASQSATSIRLTWTDNSSNETGFKIDRRESGTDPWVRITTTAANATAYTDSGLAESTTFYYKVKATGAGGDSDYSNVAGATTPAGLTPPAPPANPAATSVSQTEILFTWQDASDNETEFQLRRSLDGTDFYALPAVVLPADTTRYSDTGLEPGTTYWYKIKSRNAAGESAYTAPVSASTQAGVPAAPSGLAAEALSPSEVRLTWTDNSDNEAGFKIDRRQSMTDEWVRIAAPGAGTTVLTDAGLPPLTTFYYKVKASNAAGDSDYSNVAAVTTPEGRPAQPERLAATALSSTEIRLTWTDASDNETGFKIRRSLDGVDFYVLAPLYAGANQTSVTDSGLDAGTTYHYIIRAENAAGVSAYTTPAGAQTLAGTPSAPSAPAATALSASAIRLTWTDNSSNETGFKIDRRQSMTDEWVRIAAPGADSTTYTDSGLPASTKFYYMIKAYNAAGNSPYSELTHATTSPPGGVDTDADSLPDAWEQSVFGATDAAGPDDDPDGDGVSNYEEYVAGSDPTSDVAYFTVDVTLAGGRIAISFVTIAAAGSGYDGLERHYGLEQSPAGAAPSWTDVPGYGDLLGEGQTVTYYPENPGDAPAMYRAKVWLQ